MYVIFLILEGKIFAPPPQHNITGSVNWLEQIEAVTGLSRLIKSHLHHHLNTKAARNS
jgi:hypothetical protein